ncbi:MAG TPA: MiaB/RimO family radical SAM methylthiotransferase, partial [Polyangia bacterium]|nr:MiaB/RimO family radical SAM methylthiotransferase [Polyangia bacterium]
PCAFCIIPKLRGPQRSRDPQSVVREAEALAAAGTREICLVAQDLTTYGYDLPGGKKEGPTLAGLLAQLAQVDGLRWIRLHYAYPTAVTDELLDVMARERRIAKYLDVPIQHADDEVLKLMRRGHGFRKVRELVERVRTRVPGATLRTTFIVGHPGETEEAFGRLCDFVREADLDRVGVFSYSNEEGTHAATLPDPVPPKEIEARRRELLRIQRTISKKKLRALRGRELDVLVEGKSDESEYVLMGRHEGQAPEIDGQVYLTLTGDATPAPGDFVRARITHSAEYDLAAEVVGATTPARSSSASPGRRPPVRLPVL